MADEQNTPEFGTNSWIVEEMYRDFDDPWHQSEAYAHQDSTPRMFATA